MRKYLALLSVVALTAVAGASGATGPGTSSAAQQDLSSRAGVDRYLISLGVNPQGVVVQRGARNYAGPSCPGKGWTCSKASRVLQISKSEENRFECSPSNPVGSPMTGPDNCVIVQTSSDGNNRARCAESSDDATASQTCSIKQMSGTGNNSAQVKQSIDAKDGSVQTASQMADITQVSGSGTNAARVDQDIKQRSKSGDSSGAQKQEGKQGATVLQDSVTGDNDSSIDQSLAQDAKSKEGPSATQEQNADNNGEPDTSALVDQFSVMGRNGSHLNQRNHLSAEAKKAETVEQRQGSSSGGLSGQIDQEAAGISLSNVRQDEKQQLKVDKKTPSLFQSQFGPLRCCSSQVGNPGNRFKIDQSSAQDADAGANQQNNVSGNCFSSGECSIDQSVRQNGQTTRNSCNGPSCNIVIFCAGASTDFGVSEVQLPPPSCVASDQGEGFAAAPTQLLSLRRGR